MRLRERIERRRKDRHWRRKMEPVSLAAPIAARLPRAEIKNNVVGIRAHGSPPPLCSFVGWQCAPPPSAFGRHGRVSPKVLTVFSQDGWHQISYLVRSGVAIWPPTVVTDRRAVNPLAPTRAQRTAQ